MADTVAAARPSTPGQRATWLRTRGARWGIWILLAVPLLMLLNDIRLELIEPGSGLGPDPGEAMVEHLGSWALRILYLTLLVSSVARLLKVPLAHISTEESWNLGVHLRDSHFLSYFAVLAGLEFNRFSKM